MSDTAKPMHATAAEITIAVIEKAAIESRNSGDGKHEITIAYLAEEAAKAYKVIFRAMSSQ